MNATGKKARSVSGLTRAQLHKAMHSRKSPEKRAKMNWGKAGNHKQMYKSA